MELKSLSSIRAALLMCLLISPTAMAASNYDQLFDSGAPGWTPQVDIWSVTSGSYRNSSQTHHRAISVYDGDTWTTGYTYKVSVYADFGGGAGNRIGAIFGFVDTDNYYEVLVGMTGGVELNRLSNGTSAQLATGQVSVPGSMPGTDQFFDITIIRSGSTATVHIGPEVALSNVQLPTSAAGKIGVFTQFNLGRFDNVLVRLDSSNYSENFSNGVSGWSAVTLGASGSCATADAWSVTSGFYKNSSTECFRSISVYDGATWSSGYTYQLRMNSDFDAAGNQLGAVFNYQDPQNFHEVVIDMSGNVSLSGVTNGARSLLTTGQASVPGRDQWFTVTISRSGSSVSVNVGSETAISSAILPNVVSGRIGVLAKHNVARFDDISVTGGASTPTPLFRSGFENGITLVGPDRIGPASNPALQTWMVSLTGTESGTGTSWPPTFWGARLGSYLINTVLPGDQNYVDFLDIRFKNVGGADGTTTRVLSNTVKDVTRFPTEGGNNHARAGIEYIKPDEVTAPKTFYIRRYLRYFNVPATWGSHKYFVQHEYKTQGGCTNPRRLLVYWHSNGPGEPYYWLKMDRANGCPDENLPSEPLPECPSFYTPGSKFCPVFESTCFPGAPAQGVRHPSDQATACPQMPRGQWFWDEYFVRYSENGTSQDRAAYAVNGTVVFDYRGPIKSGPHRGIKMTPGYINFENVEVQADDVEVFDAPPCPSFPCGAPAHYQP